VTDKECVEFLQWALPRLHMRWPGFRKVRKQVCKRLRRRMRALGIDSVQAYRHYLEGQPCEWDRLDAACRIAVSRFYRDRDVYAFLETEVLPALGGRAVERGEGEVVAWSAGCASGEEPYSLALMWNLVLRARCRQLDLRILATDVDAHLLRRAATATYPPGSLKDLPEVWRQNAFEKREAFFRLRRAYRSMVEFRLQDIRTSMPDGPFDLILCRNLVFTYFDEPLQKEILEGLAKRLLAGGALVIGSHERLATAFTPLIPWSEHHQVYRKLGAR
jgi:chemotaxis protein methyltransferase CheR